jgi:hypothetical protein
VRPYQALSHILLLHRPVKPAGIFGTDFLRWMATSIRLACSLFVFFEHLQTLRELYCSYRLPPANLLQRVLIDSSTHEFSLRYLCDSRELFLSRNGIAFWLVLDRFEFEQAQVLCFLPVPVGFFSNVDGWPVRDYVRSL